ncbi:Rossman fold protein, TIGR00730 family [Actinophytocola xinjiangensis]|uniref:Cytokinin riboside 5'-monophosphate phosphoribohydrolase n=1 Tax=Actinophytocola xinjiangensis TaxID=485602 RepID=A0A7Z1B1C1_9PSEU|nr:TIGR00730 family Rossman fold protein [Actinophytocola xinjiangensis]OLF13687.1 Rossman fold protein, TIGR00730 family [Actinophytocola xinjiangensis]
MRVCVFCGSSAGRGPAYLEAAAEAGRVLAGRGIGLVYGGAAVGTMGAVADAALAAGGEVIGVIPRSLVDREVAHPSLSNLEVVADLHERKARMAELADAFLVLPGGAGTLEELFEVYTWAQLGLHAKPIALLDVDGFHQPLLGMLDHLAGEGFLGEAYRGMLIVETDVNRVLDRYASYSPTSPKWVDEHEE